VSHPHVLAGVCLGLTQAFPTVVTLDRRPDGRWFAKATDLTRLPKGCEVGVGRFDATVFAAALGEEGHAVARIANGLTRRKMVSQFWRHEKFAGDPATRSAVGDAMLYATIEDRRFNALSPLAAATFYALARATVQHRLSADQTARPRLLQDRQAHPRTPSPLQAPERHLHASGAAFIAGALLAFLASRVAPSAWGLAWMLFGAALSHLCVALSRRDLADQRKEQFPAADRHQGKADD